MFVSTVIDWSLIYQLKQLNTQVLLSAVLYFYSTTSEENIVHFTSLHLFNTFSCFSDSDYEYKIQLGPYILGHWHTFHHFRSVHHHNRLEMKQCALSSDFSFNLRVFTSKSEDRCWNYNSNYIRGAPFLRDQRYLDTVT